ncbi:pyridoxamine 5'-phosphate oxidase family protein [Rhodococcus spongiicola]|uniref:Pyridoxamine 5'-phosphate oxidase n=1 Tax=Rhodococcus spongiicola TaxID=2487352 RepID=A0A3S3BM59_9NOCA|nr:pyridoxamine 5'-phosphate oxidase family protein [Rhodococcus spongiicola]RVW04535.1 pyridoxamine 5'-phosphate oxidase [Rhodococcus spongiicola]
MTSMTREEREAFLTDVRIGVLSINEDNRGPLSVPIWYYYNPGRDLWLTAGENTRKGRLLSRAKRIGFCVQCEIPPYRYVSMEGPFTIESDDPDSILADTLRLAHRYLGTEGGDAYYAAQKEYFVRSGPIRLRLQPEHWLTFDASKPRT